ncbi:MAG TPA: biotin/lipoyl-containing protein, partial [Gammaproteobacteria bacterium]|nr:biotin/lipoyl-containing protein [Gammaproteobacteria bacterium]
MAKTFKLPDLGEGMQEAEIVNWHVKEGDSIKVDEPLLSVETDKAVVDVPSPYTGKVTKLHWAEGDVVPTHSGLADFAVEGDTDSDESADEAPATEEADKKESAKSEKPAKKAATGGKTVSFNLPDLGEGMQEAEIVNWHVKEGDSIKVDEPLLSVETDKAVVDVPSPHTGKVTKLHYSDGDVVPTGSALADFEVEGAAGDEAPEDGKKEEPISEDSGTVVGKMATSDEELQETVVIRKGRKKDVKSAKRSAAKPAQASKPAPAEPGMKPKALPSVRVYAQEQGVNLVDCQASGKNGVITREDVDQASQSGTRQPAAASVGTSFGGWDIPAPRSDVEFGKAQPLRGPRRAMHASMSKSRSEVAECTLFDDADIH